MEHTSSARSASRATSKDSSSHSASRASDKGGSGSTGSYEVLPIHRAQSCIEQSTRKGYWDRIPDNERTARSEARRRGKDSEAKLRKEFEELPRARQNLPEATQRFSIATEAVGGATSTSPVGRVKVNAYTEGGPGFGRPNMSRPERISMVEFNAQSQRFHQIEMDAPERALTNRQDPPSVHPSDSVSRAGSPASSGEGAFGRRSRNSQVSMSAESIAIREENLRLREELMARSHVSGRSISAQSLALREENLRLREEILEYNKQSQMQALTRSMQEEIDRLRHELREVQMSKQERSHRQSGTQHSVVLEFQHVQAPAQERKSEEGRTTPEEGEQSDSPLKLWTPEELRREREERRAREDAFWVSSVPQDQESKDLRWAQTMQRVWAEQEREIRAKGEKRASRERIDRMIQQKKQSGILEEMWKEGPDGDWEEWRKGSDGVWRQVSPPAVHLPAGKGREMPSGPSQAQGSTGQGEKGHRAYSSPHGGFDQQGSFQALQQQSTAPPKEVHSAATGQGQLNPYQQPYQTRKNLNLRASFPPSGETDTDPSQQSTAEREAARRQDEHPVAEDRDGQESQEGEPEGVGPVFRSSCPGYFVKLRFPEFGENRSASEIGNYFGEVHTYMESIAIKAIPNPGAPPALAPGTEALVIQKFVEATQRFHPAVSDSIRSLRSSNPGMSWFAIADRVKALFARAPLVKADRAKKIDLLKYTNGDPFRFVQQASTVIQLTTELYSTEGVPDFTTIRETVKTIVEKLPHQTRTGIIQQLRLEAPTEIDTEWYRTSVATWERVQELIITMCQIYDGDMCLDQTQVQDEADVVALIKDVNSPNFPQHSTIAWAKEIVQNAGSSGDSVWTVYPAKKNAEDGEAIKRAILNSGTPKPKEVRLIELKAKDGVPSPRFIAVARVATSAEFSVSEEGYKVRKFTFEAPSRAKAGNA